MDRKTVESVRSAVAVMTAFVDQYDDETETKELASRIASEYVSEDGYDRLITGFAHLSMWLMQRIKEQTGDEMETTLQALASGGQPFARWQRRVIRTLLWPKGPPLRQRWDASPPAVMPGQQTLAECRSPDYGLHLSSSAGH
jgi:hypothetical protein